MVCPWTTIHDLTLRALLNRIIKKWEQTECPPMEEWMKEMQSIHTMEYCSSLKRKGILTPASAWLNPEAIVLSEISQSRRTNSGWFNVYEVPREIKFIETDGMVVARGWVGVGEMRNCLMSIVSVLQAGKGCGDWLFNHVSALNTTELYTYKRLGWWVLFHVSLTPITGKIQMLSC